VAVIFYCLGSVGGECAGRSCETEEEEERLIARAAGGGRGYKQEWG